jgi:hypothetical protein
MKSAALFPIALFALTAAAAAQTPRRPMLSEAEAAAVIEQAVSSAGREPRVNITRPEFASGCPNPADPTGQADSTCAFLNAIRAAEADTLHGAGYPVLYIPHGRYRVSGDGYHAALTLSTGVSLVGDGAQSTVVSNASPHAALLTYRKAQGNCNGKAGACMILIHGITFAGAGHAGTGGLIEIDSTDTGILSDVVLANTGGIALNLQGSSERWIVSQVDINNSRWPLVAEGDTNEDYFDRVNVLTPGQDADGYCWSVNCPGGRLIQSGVWRPDPHSAVFLDGDNLHWMNSSIKDTARMGGMRMAPTTSSVTHTYFEGYPFAHQPRTNHAVEVGGKMELGHLTRAIRSTEMMFPVDDAAWQPLYVNDPADIHSNDTHSYVNAYTIYPADYVWQSSEPSHAVPGITRGTFERVGVASFASDGNAYLLARALEGTRAIAWPAGSVIEQAPPRGYGVARIEESHFNSLFADSSKYTAGCSDTEQLAEWTSSPSEMCAEIIAGLVPDGFGVPFPSQGYNAPPFTLDIESNSIYTQDELSGGGWIKIAADAEVILNQGNQPLTRFADPASALTTYINDNTRLQVVNWGSRAALAHVHDLAADVEFSPQDHYYSAEVLVNGSLSHQYIGDPCWYDGTHTARFCIHASGATQERLTNGRWVAFDAPPGLADAQPASLQSNAVPVPTRYALRDWSPGTLAPRGEHGDCARTEESTGAIDMSADPEATLIVNMTPNPGANVLLSGSIPRANTVAVEVCNQAPVAVTLPASPTILFTQLPQSPLLSAARPR